MRVIAYDTETHPFAPGRQCPPMVCLQYAEVTPSGLLPARVVLRDEGLGLLFDWLRDPEIHLVGAEVSYDVLSPVATAGVHGPELLDLFVKAYDADRVSDVLIRQKLIDLARGCYRYERNDAGRVVGQNEYNLAALAKRHLRMDLNKGTSWRRRYNELDNVPLEQWPAEALEYAREDAIATGGVWLAQWRSSSRVRLNFPGKDTADALKDEFRQVRGALALKAMAAYGLRTDPVAVKIFEEYITEDHAACVEELIESGLARREFHVSRAAAITYIQTNPELVALCVKKKRSGPPELKLGAVERAALAAKDPALQCLLDPAAETDASIAAGIVTVTEHRNPKIATERMIAWHAHNGTHPPMTKPKAKEDGTKAEPRVALDKDACESTGDHLLTAYAEMTHLAKVLGTDIPMLKDGEFLPIHTHYEPILETGRTSSAKPNVQNQARGKKDRIGARECFVPREGFVLIDADYGKLELHTLAQVCLWTIGYSNLANALNAGVDPHSKVAAEILGVPWEVNVAGVHPLEAADDYEFGNARNAAKPVNFGKPGGLGPDTLRAYSAKGYGVVRPKEFWVSVIKKWEATWPEMPAYFKMVDTLESFPRSGRYNVIQPWSERMRAGATYCAACNTFFQGLGADVAKLALWFVFKACYSEPGNPLYGARPVLFVHDQIIVETPDNANATAAANELQRLMNLAGAIVLPDCPVKCKPLLARRYSKNAKRIVGADGTLSAWEDMRLAG